MNPMNYKFKKRENWVFLQLCYVFQSDKGVNLSMYKLILTMVLLSTLTSCKFEVPGADQKFGKQNFVSAISIIELHKLRNGKYPESLKELEFLGDWDGIWLSAVRYEKNSEGYNLFLERGWAGKPTLEFPIKFKQGLGIKDTNVIWLSEKT